MTWTLFIVWTATVCWMQPCNTADIEVRYPDEAACNRALASVQTQARPPRLAYCAPSAKGK